MNWNWLRHLAAFFGWREPSGVCFCGHNRERHTHLHPRTYCGTCPDKSCERYRDNPDGVDMDAVCADEQVIEAVLADDIDYALTIAPDQFVVALVAALKDSGRAA